MGIQRLVLVLDPLDLGGFVVVIPLYLIVCT
jgi:hypothetical protein